MMFRMLIAVLAFLSTSCLTAAQEQSNNESIIFPLRPALATQQLQRVSEDSETCSLPEALTRFEEVVWQFLQEEVVDEIDIACDNFQFGTIEYCPAANCSQIFSTSQIYHFPGYYWITADNGSSIQVYCDFESEQFPYATAIIDNVEDNSCPTMEQRESVQESIQNKIQPQLSQISSSLLTCTSQITGLVTHCPGNSCSQVFDLIHEGFLRLSNYYWLRSPDGEVTEVYCNSSTMQPEYSSCQQLFMFEVVPSGTYSFRISNGTYLDLFCDNETGQGEYESCAHANLFGLPSGTYTIRPSGGSPVTVYCDMDNEECGGGVWMRVASYNFSDPNTACPGDWSPIMSPIRACSRNNSPSGSCSSALFPTNGIEFGAVCGRIIAIQQKSPDAFLPYHGDNQNSIDDYYVEGVSITYGSPRQHVWTFAGYVSDVYTSSLLVLCPCSQPSLSIPSPPSFVGNNYFCDTAAPMLTGDAYYTDDPLWDGQGCGGPSTCCSFNNPPWFSTSLPETTSDSIEARICDDDSSSSENTPITILDLYIQ